VKYTYDGEKLTQNRCVQQPKRILEGDARCSPLAFRMYNTPIIQTACQYILADCT